MLLTYSDVFEFPLPSGHRFPMHKYRLVRERLERDGRMRRVRFAVAPLARLDDLTLVHTSAYVHRVLNGELTDREVRASGFPWSPAGVQRALASTGGTVAATEDLLERRLAVCGQTAGGTHHAFADRGEGFCVFNDIAVAAAVAMRDFGVRRVLVVDLDVHQGNGTASIFQGDARVFTYSVHGQRNYPVRKERSDLDVGVADDIADGSYLEVVKRTMAEAIERADPQLVFFQAGVDPLAADRLGLLSLGRETLRERNRLVFRTFLRNCVPLVITMGGGYSRPIDASVDAHADVYLDAQACLEEHDAVGVASGS